MKTPEDWIIAFWGDVNPSRYDLLGFIEAIQRDAQAGAWEWLALSDSDFRLRMGECTAQEIRTCRAMLRAILETTTNNPTNNQHHV